MRQRRLQTLSIGEDPELPLALGMQAPGRQLQDRAVASPGVLLAVAGLHTGLCMRGPGMLKPEKVTESTTEGMLEVSSSCKEPLHHHIGPAGEEAVCLGKGPQAVMTLMPTRWYACSCLLSCLALLVQPPQVKCGRTSVQFCTCGSILVLQRLQRRSAVANPGEFWSP